MKTLACLISIILLSACSNEKDKSTLRKDIKEIISSKNATYGIGIYNFDTKDTLFINGDNPFVMMSVVKFFQAVALLHQVDEGNIDFDKKLIFTESELLRNTYSPYKKERKDGSFELSLSDALSYTVCQSDNIVCDKLFQVLGGPNEVEEYLHGAGFQNISIGTDYINMDKNTIYANQSSPKEMIQLLKRFRNNELLSKNSTDLLWQKLVETSTGPNRLKGLLPNGTTVGHKTGTSGTNDKGITAAYNDVGIIELPNGKSFAIVVFISDTKENDETNAKTIAEISKAAYKYFSTRN